MSTLAKARTKAKARAARIDKPTDSKPAAAKTLDYNEGDHYLDNISQEELDEIENTKFDDPSMFEPRKKMKPYTDIDLKDSEKVDDSTISETESEEELASSPPQTQVEDVELCKWATSESLRHYSM